MGNSAYAKWRNLRIVGVYCGKLAEGNDIELCKGLADQHSPRDPKTSRRHGVHEFQGRIYDSGGSGFSNDIQRPMTREHKLLGLYSELHSNLIKMSGASETISVEPYEGRVPPTFDQASCVFFISQIEMGRLYFPLPDLIGFFLGFFGIHPLQLVSSSYLILSSVVALCYAAKGKVQSAPPTESSGWRILPKLWPSGSEAGRASNFRATISWEAKGSAFPPSEDCGLISIIPLSTRLSHVQCEATGWSSPSTGPLVRVSHPSRDMEDKRLEDYVSGFWAGFQGGKSGHAFPSICELNESFRLLLKHRRTATRTREGSSTMP
ncbi:hypothetical protein QJS10_CPA08g00754 [Acorus calamus]|uniref:Uncharacterized protein n=1 Tax=Acorus calamus TaxID=4465 RepID=A0AAV9EF33_ACOCL|nr:hypothetical protein QJS10_CPA08g00754 [Acorus calamus]